MLGLKRQAEGLLQSDNPKIRASSLDVLAACTSQWLQSLPSDSRAQGLAGIGAMLNGAGGMPTSLFGRPMPRLQLHGNNFVLDTASAHSAEHQLSSLLANPLRGPLSALPNRPGQSLVQQLQGSLQEQLSVGGDAGLGGFAPLPLRQSPEHAQRGGGRKDAHFGNYSSALGAPHGAHQQQQQQQPTEAAYNKYCHFCQHVKVKRADSMFACQNKHCSRRFCDNCLKVHLAPLIKEDQGARQPWDPAWSCPVCRKTCCCSIQDCKKDHRHCKAFRYRRRRAEVTPKTGPTNAKRPAETGEGPWTEMDTLSPAGPETSPAAGPRKSTENKASIEALLSDDADATHVWLTPSCWARPPKGRYGSGDSNKTPTEILESSGSSSASPAPSDASSVRSGARE